MRELIIGIHSPFNGDQSNRNMNSAPINIARFSLLGILTATSLWASDEVTDQAKHPAKPIAGKAEAEARCLICHGNTQTGQQRLAPPMVMVKRHYQSLSQAEFEKAVMAWVKKPEAKKSKMPGAIRRFNLMPTFVIPEAEVKRIANYIYKTDFAFPANCGHSSVEASALAKAGKTGETGKGKTGTGCDDTNCGGPGNKAAKGSGDKKGKGCDDTNCGPPKGGGNNSGSN